jgi:2-polyprenyl-3-methyl-5-hydroxy-6-metoxy-1,4-benzoquinol methylase
MDSMGTQPDNWVDYWDTQTIFDNEEWMKGMEFFIKATEPILNYSSDDIILDFGCGTGNIAAFLKNRVKEIHGIDTSQHFIQFCKNQFKDDANCFFAVLNNQDYFDLSCLKRRDFTLIICLGVIQYYRNIGEVEKMIQVLREIAAPGARLLIADIHSKTNMLADLFALVKVGFRERRLFKTIKFMIQAKFSDYSKVRSDLGLLILSDQEILDMVDRLGLDADLITDRLVRKEGRRHLLIRF